MKKNEKIEFIKYLEAFVTENKKNVIGKVLENRTNYLSVLLENIREPHNASAVVRSCDAFGIQDVYLVEKNYSFNANLGISKGASKWVDLKCHSNLSDAIKTVKKNGYKIVVTSPAQKKTVADISLEQKTILAFGTESSGASDELLEYADELVSIPMFGFTESFNISVSVAICLYELTLRLHASDLNWRFSDGQKLDTKITWLKNILKDPRKYSQYLKDKGFLI